MSSFHLSSSSFFLLLCFFRGSWKSIASEEKKILQIKKYSATHLEILSHITSKLQVGNIEWQSNFRNTECLRVKQD